MPSNVMPGNRKCVDMKNLLKFSAVAFILCLVAGMAKISAAPIWLFPQQKTINGKPAAAPVFTPDRGKFRIVLDGNIIGS